MAANKIVEVLMIRDAMTRGEAIEALRDARKEMHLGGFPEEILQVHFRLGSEYIYELIDDKVLA